MQPTFLQPKILVDETRILDETLFKKCNYPDIPVTISPSVPVPIQEPLSTDSPLWDMENLLLSPHNADLTPTHLGTCWVDSGLTPVLIRSYPSPETAKIWSYSPFSRKVEMVFLPFFSLQSTQVYESNLGDLFAEAERLYLAELWWFQRSSRQVLWLLTVASTHQMLPAKDAAAGGFFREKWWNFSPKKGCCELQVEGWRVGQDTSSSFTHMNSYVRCPHLEGFPPSCRL